MLRPAATRKLRQMLACVLWVSVATGPTLVHSRESLPAQSAVTIQVAQLPEEGRATYRLVFQGGPFAHGKDGSVFGNRERLLPSQARGYYREYTVRTPGARDRGARRIVCGGRPRTPDACYYTADHYASFLRIVE